MINANDIEKLKQLLQRANELSDQDLYPAKRVLDEVLEVSKRNPEINFSGEYDSLLSQFEEGEKKISKWNLAKENLTEQIETILFRFDR
ncbi:hypothetical protein [Pedobacter sp. N23S346]|uniref:hypothetical protein n=1 Tax=Pedobacter sp. N23S346 TaxID=3402750 RepID=UPI003AC9C43E